MNDQLIDYVAIQAEHDCRTWEPEGSPCVNCGQATPCDAQLAAKEVERLVSERNKQRSQTSAWKATAEARARGWDAASAEVKRLAGERACVKSESARLQSEVDILEAYASDNLERGLRDWLPLRCELVDEEGLDRCQNPTVAMRWEDGFPDAVCISHANSAEDRGALVIRTQGDVL